MADMTREEVDAKILANEARSDAQVAAILAKIDAIIARMDAFEREMRETTRDIVAEMRTLKKTMVITIISAGLAVVFGVAGFNAALLNNMSAMYDSGTASGEWRSKMEHRMTGMEQQMADNRAETRQQAAETRQILDKINQRLDAIEAHQRVEAERGSVKRERESGRN